MSDSSSPMVRPRAVRWGLVPGGVVVADEGGTWLHAFDVAPLRLHTEPARWVAVGDALLVAPSTPGDVTLWSIGGRCVSARWPSLPCRAACLALHLHSDGTVSVAVGGSDEHVHVGREGAWQSHVRLGEVPVRNQDLWSPSVRAVAFREDGTWVAVGGTGSVYDGTSEPVGEMEDLAYAEDAQSILLPDGTIALFDDEALWLLGHESGLARRRGRRPEQVPWQGPTGTALVAGAGASWQVVSGATERRTVRATFADCAAVDAAGRQLLAGHRDGSLSRGDQRWRGLERTIVDLAVHVDGHLAMVDGAGTLTVHRDRGSLAAAAEPVPALVPCRSFALDPGRLLALPAAHGEAHIAVVGEQLRVHRLSDGACVHEVPGGEPQGAFVDHDLFVVAFRGRVEILDAATLTSRGGGDVPPNHPALFGFVPAGAVLNSTTGLVFAGRDGTVSTIDTGARCRRGVWHHYGTKGALRPDGAVAAIAPVDRSGILLELPTGTWRAEPKVVNPEWSFSPDGRWLLDGRSGALFDGHTGAHLRQLPHDGPTTAAWLRGARGPVVVSSGPAGIAVVCPENGGVRSWVQRRPSALDELSTGWMATSPGHRSAVVEQDGRCYVLGLDGALRSSVAAPSRAPLLPVWLDETRCILEPQLAPDTTCWLFDGADWLPLRSSIHRSHWCGWLQLGSFVARVARPSDRREDPLAVGPPRVELFDGHTGELVAAWVGADPSDPVRWAVVVGNELCVACSSGRVHVVAPPPGLGGEPPRSGTMPS